MVADIDMVGVRRFFILLCATGYPGDLVYWGIWTLAGELVRGFTWSLCGAAPFERDACYGAILNLAVCLQKRGIITIFVG